VCCPNVGHVRRWQTFSLDTLTISGIDFLVIIGAGVLCCTERLRWSPLQMQQDLQRDITINMDIPRPSSAPIGPLSPLRRSDAYAHSLGSSERHQATFLDDIEMQAGWRNPRNHGSSDIPGDETVASSSHSSAAPNASSTFEQEEIRGSSRVHLLFWWLTLNATARLPISDRVYSLARLFRHPFSRSTKQDQARLDKEWGYDDIKYENSKCLQRTKHQSNH